MGANMRSFKLVWMSVRRGVKQRPKKKRSSILQRADSDSQTLTKTFITISSNYQTSQALIKGPRFKGKCA